MSDGDTPSTQIDECCDLFERHWGTGKAFSIEDVLSKVPEKQKAAYLESLLAVELELRNRCGEVVPAADLHARFPAFASTVAHVLANPLVEDSLDSQKTIAPSQLAVDSDGVPASPGLRIPRQLGRYRIVRKLGQGAMGSVFLAHDEQLDRQVALKIPRGDLQRNREIRLRFEREAQAAASLHHPNICPIYDIAEFEGVHFICMGYIEGFSLSRYAIAESGLSEQRIAELVLKLSKALAVAHEGGFIHRDLKPANVMVDHADEPVILDFGLARKIDRDEDIRVTQTGTTIGSPAYMSPEQVDGDQDKVGIHSDIYSLGVILYELLTGRIPFEGSLASVMGQIMTRQPDKPSEYRKDLSVRLENICQRMMEKDQEKRHPSMHAVSAALEEYLEKYGATTQKSKPATEQEKAGVNKGQQRKEQIKQLIKSGDYSQAEKLMVVLSRETNADLLDAAAWAASELPVLRKTREEVRAGRQEMYSTASRLMKAHDYEQAVRLLEEYPYDLRTPKMQELLERAEGTAYEVKRLKKDIKAAQNRGDTAAVLSFVRQLLELKPADRRAKDLYEHLTKKSAGPISKALGKKTPRPIARLSAGVQWGLLAAVLVVPCCHFAYRWSDTFLNSLPLKVPEPNADPGEDTEAASAGEQRSSNRNLDIPPATGDGVPFPADAKFIKAKPLRNLNEFGSINAYPWISPDGLTIWWTREGKAAESAIYQASRASVSSEFSAAKLVLSNARIATVSSDHRELIALRTANQSYAAVATRTDSQRPFSTPQPMPEFAHLRSARCFSLNENGTRLVFQDRSFGGGLFVFTRSSRNAPWSSTAQPVAVTSPDVNAGAKVGWGQLLNSGRLLVHTLTVPGRDSQEHATVSRSLTGDFSFGNSKAISIDGYTEKNVRSPRYCPATGELFYTQCTGPLNAPGSKTELWVAKATSSVPKNIPQASIVDVTDDWTDLLSSGDLRNWQGVVANPVERNAMSPEKLRQAQMEANQSMKQHWRVSNGVLEFDGSGASISTFKEYGDFELSLDWKIEKGGDSGIYLRGSPQVQIWDPDSGKKGAQHGSGGLFNNQKNSNLPTVRADRPIGQWNTFHIRMVGEHVTVDLNGRRVVDNVVFENYYDRRQPIYPRGPIELQKHDGSLQFRNIRIREIQ